jgi:signal transduction histidine kinase
MVFAAFGPLSVAAIAALAAIFGAVGAVAAMRRRERRREAAIGRALAKLSHDLRGTMAPAMLMAERLERHADATVRRSAEVISQTVMRATAMATAITRVGAAASDRREGGLQGGGDAGGGSEDGVAPGRAVPGEERRDDGTRL